MAARAVGIDAFNGGWVAVAVAHGRRTARVDRVWAGPRLDVLLADEPSSTVVGLDLPLGGVAGQWRVADAAAKGLLGRQHSKVFSVPPRSVWELPYTEANARCRQLTGAGLSVQAFRLLPKMLEAEAYRDGGPHELHEIHPELVFVRLTGGLVTYGKKTWNGQMARRALLDGVGLTLPPELAEAGDVPPNDVLDAAAVAWGTVRIARGQAGQVPDPAVQVDHRGRPIVIRF